MWAVSVKGFVWHRKTKLLVKIGRLFEWKTSRRSQKKYDLYHRKVWCLVTSPPSLWSLKVKLSLPQKNQHSIDSPLDNDIDRVYVELNRLPSENISWCFMRNGRLVLLSRKSTGVTQRKIYHIDKVLLQNVSCWFYSRSANQFFFLNLCFALWLSSI